MYPGQQHRHYQRPPVPPPGYVQQKQYQRPMNPPPSNQMQSSVVTNHGRVQQFQYSNCTGRKKALLIGINYFGSKNQLGGCINDVRTMSRYLHDYHGYAFGDMVILTDDTRDMRRVPTKQNMLRAMQWLVKDARPNDSLFFHYSGHGGRTQDLDGDEVDGFDDVIYPVDFQVAGHIVDDQMHDIMVRPLRAGVRLTALFDSCHSGTALDLPFVYRAQDGGIKEYNIWKESKGDAMQAIMGYATGNTRLMANSVSSVFSRFKNSNSSQADRVKQQKMSPADVISFSGCKDTQTSSDSSVNGIATGAMSWAFITVMTQNPVQSYITLLQNVRVLLAQKYSQKPQLSSSHPIDVNLRFVL
ncbi:unnamed protein product [Kuraishia capsulata CBS 1993]|uniref:Metacaspase-1 n=1 Tax=Kuraishia capsulata CBS 1993 TaxID=1382522 RepID=W6MXI1_9ASCO|nr:uncharacterized protein KUCA_T00004916001 [Kuraishia capsulata CBS 1993]CDK28930.1 unnamed protein product [Kuraishia capsulata CBS 1993]